VGWLGGLDSNQDLRSQIPPFYRVVELPHRRARDARRVARPLLVAMTLAMCDPALADALEDAETAFELQDYTKALQIWQPLADQGNGKAQFGLGALYSSKGNFTEAMKWYRRAADQGYPRAQHHLGFLYGAGLHVPQDLSRYLAAHRSNKTLSRTLSRCIRC
jgi:uncharacterized protein